MQSTWYGKLSMVVGPMFARKSTSLVHQAFWCRDKLKRPIMILKPKVDNRYAAEEIVTHDGIRIDAMPITTWPEIPDNTSQVFIDEVQFLDAPHFVGNLAEEVRILLRRGIDVMGAGLDMDWRGRPFPVTAELLAMADDITKVHAVCNYRIMGADGHHQCGAPATKNFKLAPNDLTVEVGAGDKYQARCNQHWHDHGALNDD